MKKNSTNKKKSGDKANRPNLQQKVGGFIKKATLSTGEKIIPKELVDFAVSNVEKVRKESLMTIAKEIGKSIEEITTNYTIKLNIEVNFEPKNKSRRGGRR